MNVTLELPNRCQLISKSTGDIPDSVNSSMEVIHEGHLSYTGPETSNRVWAILADSKVLSVYTENKENFIIEMNLKECELISQETDKEEFRLTMALDDTVHVITTDQNDPWVKVFQDIIGIEIHGDEQSEDVFHNSSNVSNIESSSIDSLQKELQDEIRRLESKKGSMASTLDGLAMGWGICPGKANIWCKYYLLRQYSSSLSAAESSTLMTTDDGTMSSSSTSTNYGVVLLQIDGVQDYLKKQFRRSLTIPNTFIEKQVEELTEVLEGINNDINATEQDQAMTIGNINEKLTKEMDELRSLYGPPESPKTLQENIYKSFGRYSKSFIAVFFNEECGGDTYAYFQSSLSMNFSFFLKIKVEPNYMVAN
ncbi:hypothetical protein GQR58_029019 [Nymphon striatum]|nr:hypothetical protein GQR58_029019 [Nymphon striatum]